MGRQGSCVLQASCMALLLECDIYLPRELTVSIFYQVSRLIHRSPLVLTLQIY